MRSVDELIERVRSQGGKATSQRILIWGALVNDLSHPTADDLYCRLKPQLPSLSQATLYNVLNELVEWGEIRRFDTGDGHIHFDPDTSGPRGAGLHALPPGDGRADGRRAGASRAGAGGGLPHHLAFRAIFRLLP